MGSAALAAETQGERQDDGPAGRVAGEQQLPFSTGEPALRGLGCAGGTNLLVGICVGLIYRHKTVAIAVCAPVTEPG